MSQNDDVLKWSEWLGRFRTRLVCTKTDAYYTTKELQQHWDEILENQKSEGNPSEVFGRPEDLAATYNENYWRGFVVRQSVIIPMTAVTTFFACLLLYRLSFVHWGGEIFPENNLLEPFSPLAILAFEVDTTNVEQTTPNPYLNGEISTNHPALTFPKALHSLWGAQTSREHRDDLVGKGYIRSDFLIDCTTYSRCSPDESYLLLTSWHRKENGEDIGYSFTKSLSIVHSFDQNLKKVRSSISIKRHFSTQRPIFIQLFLDLFPWIAACLSLRWAAIVIFELIALISQNATRFREIFWRLMV